MTLILKSMTDVEDLTVGCTFFGTGGGGSKDLGLLFLYPHIDAGKTIKIVDVNTINDDDWVACPFYSGTIAPPTPEIVAARSRYPWDFLGKELSTGLTMLEEHNTWK
jgi:DUF917 family protein